MLKVSIGSMFLALLVLSCNRDGGASKEAATRPLTSHAIAVANLERQIQLLEKLDRVESIDRERFLNLKLAHAQFLGAFDTYLELTPWLEKITSKDSKDYKEIALQVKALSSVHRFDEALSKLDSYKGVGVQPAAIRAMKQNIMQAKGEGLDAGLKERLDAVQKHPTLENNAMLAAVYTERQEIAKADKYFAEALVHYRDVSPFAIAWINFLRGKLWGEDTLVPDLEKAKTYYTAALNALPEYVQARVHLAEVYIKLGDLEKALTTITPALSAQDPEPKSIAATIFSMKKDNAKSQMYRDQAEKGYARLVEKEPLAFADHAAEFYLKTGDNPVKALELAQINLKNRATFRSYQLAIAASLAAKNQKAQCEILKQLESSVKQRPEMEPLKKPLEGCLKI
jgi:Tfp pilus assembly protein PilF